jgi:hypothetical protein
MAESFSPFDDPPQAYRPVAGYERGSALADHPVICPTRSVTMAGMTTPEAPYDPTATRATPLGSPAAPVDGAGPYLYPLTHQLLPAPRKKRTGLILALVAAAVVLLVGAGIAALTLAGVGPAAAPPTFGFNGTLQITGGCTGGGFSDIQDGTQVVVTDEKQTVLAAAPLVSDGPCKWTFLVRNVPASAKFYGLTISHRGTVQYTETQLRAGPHLTL